MSLINELKSHCQISLLRYGANQGGDHPIYPLRTGTVNEGGLKMHRPEEMLPFEVIERGICSSKHPLTEKMSLLLRLRARITLHLFTSTFIHRFDLVPLNGKLRPLLEKATPELNRQWNTFIRPNGPLYFSTRSIELFLRTLLQRKVVELDLPSGQKYVTLNTLNLPKKVALVTKRTLSSPSQENPTPMIPITKEGVEAIREIGVCRLLSSLGLTDPIHFGIGHTTMEGRRAFLSPFRHFEHVDSLDNNSNDEQQRMQMIGLVHALLHAQDGVWGNIARIRQTDNEYLLMAYDLGKSMIPARMIDDSSAPPRLTLCSAILETPLIDTPLPQSVRLPYSSEECMKSINRLHLVQILDPEDPLKKDPALLAKAESSFKQRALTLYALCSKEGPLTLRDVFEGLYPEEMLFISAAKKMGQFHYNRICPLDILMASRKQPDRFSKSEIDELYSAYQTLKEDMMPITDYFPLWHEQIKH